MATLCSLALCLWGYQLNTWILVIPMVCLIEARAMTTDRRKLSSANFQLLHLVAGLIWLLGIFYFPFQSPSPVQYTVLYHLIKYLPFALFPLVLCQTYCTNCSALYHQAFSHLAWMPKTINVYYPYFAICLLAASATAGHQGVFLTAVAILVAAFLWASRSVSSPRHPLLFGSLMGLALLLSILGTGHLYWLQASLGNLGQSLVNILRPLSSPVTWEPRHPNPHLPPALESWLEQVQANHTHDPGHWPEIDFAHQDPEPTAASHSSPESSQQPPAPGRQSQASPSGAAPNPTAPKSETNSGIPTAVAEPGATAEIGTDDPPQRDGSSTASPASSNGIPIDPLLDYSGGSSPRQPALPAGTHAQTPSTQRPAGSQLPPSLIQQSNDLQTDPDQSVTQLGNTGTLQLSNTIVFRVAPGLPPAQSPAFPLHIREASYNDYRDGAWHAVTPDFQPQAPQSQQRWILAPSSPNSATIEIFATLRQGQGTLKLPVGTTTIDRLDVQSMRVNPYGTVVIQGQPGTMLNYQVQFDPTQAHDSAPTDADLAIPERERSTLQTILQTLDLTGQSDITTVQKISNFFQDDFQYSLQLPESQSQTTPLATFLLNHRRGHCEYFASATALLLRAAGIPSRYTVGYVADEYDDTTNQYIVRLRHAHAWVMAYVDDAWVTIDTTPSSQAAWGESTAARGLEQPEPSAGAVSELGQGVGRQAAPSDQGNGDRAVTTTAQTGAAHSTNDAKEANTKRETDHRRGESWLAQMAEAWSTFVSQFPDGSNALIWPIIFIGLGVAIIVGPLLILLVRSLIGKKRLRRWRRRMQRPHRPGADAQAPEFHLIEQRLEDWNLKRGASEPLMQWTLRLKQALPDATMVQLQQIIDLHYRYRFDPDGLELEDRNHLRALIRAWLQTYDQPSDCPVSASNR